MKMSLLLALAAFSSVAAGVSAQCAPLAEIATAAGLTSLVDAVASVAELEAAAPLVEIVLANGTEISEPITVFAPTNEAFMEIASTVATLDPEMILAVLLNHILLTKQDVAALIGAAPSTYPTALTTELSTEVVGANLTVISGPVQATVVTPNYETCAGIVHIIDKVLVPVLDDSAEAPFAEGPMAMSPMSATDFAPMAAPASGSYGAYGGK